MSFLVELARSAFPADALDGFTTTSQFGLDNARAMMWMSQLAYETSHETKVDSILASWSLTKRAFRSNDPITGLPPKSACVVVTGGRGATIVSFSGTDPLKEALGATDVGRRTTPPDDYVHPALGDPVEASPAPAAT